MEKAHLVAQPFQLIAQQRRKAYQLSGSGGRQRKRFADDHLCTSLQTRSAIGVLSVSKRESGTELQNVSCCMQGPGETGETWTYPSGTCASLYSNGHDVVAARRTKVPPGNLPLPFPTRSEN